MVTLINHYSLINHYIPHKRSSLLASDITGASFLLLLLLPAVSSCCSSPMFTGSPMATRLHSACLTWTQSSSKGLLSSSPCHHHGYYYQLFWKHCTFIYLMLNVQNNGVKMSRSTLMLFNLSSGPEQEVHVLCKSEMRIRTVLDVKQTTGIGFKTFK